MLYLTICCRFLIGTVFAVSAVTKASGPAAFRAFVESLRRMELNARLGPMRGLQRHRSARILAGGHAFVQNLRRGHYDIATHVPLTSSALPSTSSP